MITLKDVWGNKLFESSSMDKRGALEQAVAEGADLTLIDSARDLEKYNARLKGADLRRADLKGAALYGANLTFATLKDSDLRNVDLRGCILYGADLRGIKFNQYTLLGGKAPHHWKAEMDKHTKMDDDFRDFVLAHRV